MSIVFLWCSLQCNASIPRKTTRPWSADEKLNEVCSWVMRFLTIIRNSDVFQERFQELVKSIQNNPAPDAAGKIRSVRAAKHRMESCQTPLGRFVLYLDAMLTLTCEIVVLRRDKDDGKTVADFLDFLTDSNLVLVAMLADAGDEPTQHLRFFDRESYDIGRIGACCAECQHRLDYLFMRGNCCKLGCRRLSIISQDV